MQESTLTVKGQTTVPQPIREALHAHPGTKLHWHLMPDGSIIVRAKIRSILDLAASLTTPKTTPKKKVKITDMNAWRSSK